MRMFLTMFLTVVLMFLELGTLFVSLGGTVLIQGRKLSHGIVFHGIGLFTVFYEGLQISCFWIETLQD